MASTSWLLQGRVHLVVLVALCLSSAQFSRPDLIDSALLRPGRLDKSLLCNMPDFEERKDVLPLPYSITGPLLKPSQILKAVARKITVSESVDFDEIASKTDGFSGADLQALLYNAHLDAIHASIADLPSLSTSSGQDDDTPVEYTILSDPSAKSKLSKAEEMALQRRVGSCRCFVRKIPNTLSSNSCGRFYQDVILLKSRLWPPKLLSPKK